MDNDDIFPPWGDLDDGKPSVWACDWFIDEGQAIEDTVLTVAYDYREEFILKYNEIKEAFDNDAVKELLAKYINEEVKEENIKELKDFFFHWLMFAGKGGNVDTMFDDNDITDRDEDFVESENRTLH